MVETICKCGKTYQVPDEMASEAFFCESCGASVVARPKPAPPAVDPEATFVIQPASAAPVGYTPPPPPAPAPAPVAEPVAADVAPATAANPLGGFVEGLKALVADPSGKQDEAFAAFGPTKAMLLGAVLALGAVLGGYLVSQRSFAEYTNIGGQFRSLFAAGFHVIMYVGGFLVMSLIAEAKMSMQQSIFATGVSLLPTAVAFFISWAIGRWSATSSLVGFISLVCTCATIVLVYGSLRTLPKLSTAKAFWATVVLVPLATFIFSMIGIWYDFPTK